MILLRIYFAEHAVLSWSISTSTPESSSLPWYLLLNPFDFFLAEVLTLAEVYIESATSEGVIMIATQMYGSHRSRFSHLQQSFH